jgi:hypothetical protein
MKTTIAKTIALAVAVGFSLPAFAHEVDARQANQQHRIAQGVRSGQLTPGETARLERREGHTRREIHRDRVAHGGTLTPREHAKINREENRTSRQIEHAKHNGRHA